MTSAPDRTAHAQNALALSERFRFELDARRYGRRRPRRLELSEADGLSTAGGRVARQNLVLVPEDDSGASRIVVGWVDASSRRAELRSFRMLGKQFEARHGRGIDLEVDAYDELDADLEGFLGKVGIDLARVDGPTAHLTADAVAEAGPRESSGPMLGMLALGIGLGLGLGYLLFGVVLA